MINLLPPKLEKKVCKADLIKLERDVIRTLQWDVQWTGPQVYLERYLWLIGLHHLTSQVMPMAQIFLKFVFRKSDLCLGHK